jgi:transposase
VSPEILPDDIAALRALVVAARAERDAERAEKARLIEERDQLAGQNDRLRRLIRQLQRMQFGRRSEKLDPDQFNLALEDLEQAVAASQRNGDIMPYLVILLKRQGFLSRIG